MQFEDYLLREISRVSRAIARAMGAMDEGDEEGANEAITDGLRVLVGLSAPVLSRLSGDALWPLLSVNDRLEVSKVVAVGELLRLAAQLESRPAEAHQLRVGAVRIWAMVPIEARIEGFVPRLDALCRQVHPTALDGEDLERLVRHYEGAGAFSRAEDMVHAWLDVDVGAAFAAGMAFYERLWSYPDTRVAAGGMDPDDILEGIGELQRRAGKK